MRRNLTVIAILFVAALLSTVILIVWGKDIALRLHEEVFKLLANLVITLGIGGVAGLAVNELFSARERREARRTLALSTLKDIVDSYNTIKRIRRQLRAQAVRPDYSDPNAYVLEQPYGDLMCQLNEAQLKLESHLRLVTENAEQYPKAALLQKGLDQAESYVGDLMSEWEDCMGHFVPDPTQNFLVKFKVLRCFLGEAKQSFKPGFSAPLANVFSILGQSTGNYETC